MRENQSDKFSRLIRKVLGPLLRTAEWRFGRHVTQGHVVVGHGTYGSPLLLDYTLRNKPSLIIGNYCSIAGNVTVLVEANHRTENAAMYPILERLVSPGGSVSMNPPEGPVKIGHDVWIGYGSTIVGSCKIGNGAVVAAGSVVVKDVRSFAIVGGVPAREIRRRFPDDICEALDEIGWWDLPESEVAALADVLLCEPEVELLDREVKKRKSVAEQLSRRALPSSPTKQIGS
jgi:acetyltransferase-like isoleucine patch superfamily enzyme